MDETRLIFPFSLKEREIEMKKRVYTLYRVSTKGQVEKDDIPMDAPARFASDFRVRSPARSAKGFWT